MRWVAAPQKKNVDDDNGLNISVVYWCSGVCGGTVG